MEPHLRDIVLAYYDAVDAGDTERLLAMFHPAVEYRRGGYPAISGARELRHFYEEVRMIGSGKHVVHSMVAEGQEVGVRGSFSGTSRDGRDLSVEWADFFTFEGELIRVRFTYFMAPGV